MKTLSDILANVGNSSVARRQAGLQLKNRLTSNDDAVKQNYQERWLAVPDEIRGYIKNNILTALGSESYRPSAAAQCVQCVAVVELPRNLWPDLMRILVTNVTNPHRYVLVFYLHGNSSIASIIISHSALLVVSTSTKKSMDFITFIRQLYTKQFRIS